MPDRVGPSIHRVPARTSLAYLVAAGSWIVGSDLVVDALWGTNTDDTVVNIIKGLGFVLFTAAVLYVVLRSWANRTMAAWSAATRARKRFEVLVEGTADIIAVLDENGVISYASPSLTRVLGWSAADAVGVQGRTYVHPDDVADAVDYLAMVRAGRGPSEPQTFRLLTPTGRWRHIELVATDLRHEPSVGGVVVHGRDVTDRNMARTRLEEVLTHDPVTGVSNRATFEDDLRDASLGAAARGQSLLVLVVDINAFRHVNEEVGRLGGDDVLREVAARIDRCAQPAALARIGADEFGVAVPAALASGEAEADAAALGRRIASSLAEPVVTDGHRLHLSAAVGGAVLSPAGRVDRALVAAETNLAHAKSHPDQVVISVVSADDRTGHGRSQLAGALHDALDRGELELHYQPQYDLRSGEVVAAEGLLRWRHPTEGLLLPRSFLAEATRGPLLPHVTRFVLEAATRQAVAWRDTGHPIAVSVNLSLGDLRRHSVVDEVLGAVQTSGLDPTMLRLELTEQTLLAEPERSLKAMRQLREAGIEFSIDDFGTGYSSLVHLRTLPVHQLKIDKTFVAGMADGGIDDVIVTAVLDLGHRTDLVIVAEGIETIECYRLLAEQGCDRGQGYLMSAAVPADELSFAAFDPSGP